MLHILLLILKIIGIILAAILGILVLLVCIVLFVPLKYDVRSECDGTLEGLTACMRCTWLLRIIRVTISWQEKELQWSLKVLWMKRPKKEDVNAYEEKSYETVEEKEEESQKSGKDIEVAEKEMEEEPELSEGSEEKYEKVETRISEKIKSTEAKKSKLKKISDAFRNVYRKITYTINQICVKIKMMIRKKEKIQQFLQDEVHKEAFIKIKNEAFRLLRRLKPKKLAAYVHYGFEDPCTTGQVLAGVSILYPFLGTHTQIVPDFENRILEGNIQIRGKLRGIHFVMFACRLLLCRAIRSMYKDVRSFEL